MDTNDNRPPAFILLGGFGVICRNQRYVSELRARGLHVLLIMPSSFGAAYAAALADPRHFAHQITEVAQVQGSMREDGSFTAGVLSEYHRWTARYSITGVFAVGEVMVEQAGIIADLLGVPGPGFRASRIVRSKVLQRCYLSGCSPRFSIVAPQSRDLGLPFDGRLVLKPSGRHSSSGVRVVESTADFRRALEDYGDTEILLLEQEVVGPEYSVETLVQDRREVFASVTAKDTNAGSGYFVEMGHTVPAPPSPAVDALLRLNRTVLETLDVRDGVTHAEFKLDGGTPKLMEITARTPGDALTVLYRLATGEDFEREVLRIMLAEPAHYPAPKRVARQFFLPHEPGTFAGVEITGPALPVHQLSASQPWPRLDAPVPVTPGAEVHAVLVSRKPGEELGPIRSSDDRAASVILTGDDHDAVAAVEAELRTRIRIRSG